MTWGQLLIDSGGDPNKQIELLKNDYQWRLDNLIVKWFIGYPYGIDFDEMWNKVKESLSDWQIGSDIYLAIFDIFRKYILEIIRQGSVHEYEIRSDLLKAYYYKRQSLKEYNPLSVNAALSALSREEFNYFVERYYYIDDSTKNNLRLEKKIAKVFKLRGSAWLYRVNGAKPLVCDEADYLSYLENTSKWFFYNIKPEGVMIEHPDLQEYSLVKRRAATGIFVFKVMAVVIAIGYGILFIMEHFQ